MAEKEAVQVAQYLNDKLIFLNANFANTDELFDNIYQTASGMDYVTPEFITKIKKREATFPTGLQLENRGVAIPHTDADTIKHEFVAVISNKKPIAFKRMDDPDSTTDARVIFVLGLNKPHAQLEMLQQLMGIIQNSEILDGLENAQDVSTVHQLLK